MTTLLYSLAFAYCFIALGFVAKQIFNEQIDNKTLSIVSVYFFQPFVAAWGFGSATLSSSHLEASLWYVAIVVALFIPNRYIVSKLIKEPKSRSILSISLFIGNTGNIGIPLGIALFGSESILYTTLINLLNIAIAYTLGVYSYSRGTLDIKSSLLNILKIPIVPVSLIAIGLNLASIETPKPLMEILTYGAYFGIVLQLFLLGVFLQGIKREPLSYLQTSYVMVAKLLLLPLVGYVVLGYSHLSYDAQLVVLMELSMPLAVANLNMASLYDCKPYTVASYIGLSTLLYMPLLLLFHLLLG